jgi:hypothetical protein
LLGDPEAEAWTVILGRDFKFRRTEFPTDEAFGVFISYLTRNFENDLPGSQNLAVEFLERHYSHEILDLDGKPCNPCWECMKMSMADTRILFTGKTSLPCPGKKCRMTTRYPVLEYLAATEPKAHIGKFLLWNCSCELLEISNRRSKQTTTESDSSAVLLAAGEWENIIRIAIWNGRGGFIEAFLSDDLSPLFGKGLPGKQDFELCVGSPSIFEKIVPEMQYHSVTDPNREPRSFEQERAIEDLAENLSADHVHRILRRIFLPGSIWDPQIIAILIERCADIDCKAYDLQPPEGRLKNPPDRAKLPILHQVVRNLAYSAHCKPTDTALVCKIIDLFIDAYATQSDDNDLKMTVSSIAEWVGSMRPVIRVVTDAVVVRCMRPWSSLISTVDEMEKRRRMLGAC